MYHVQHSPPEAPAPRGGRVAVAMSGGVDSSVTAALLVSQGFAAEGVTMRLWKEYEPADAFSRDAADAATVCRQLGIPHRVVDLRDVFYQQVVRYFLAEYARGRTPNPCIRCNQAFKFGVLFDQMRSLGYDYLATGHYARTGWQEGAWRLWRARDLRKDQSYVLYGLSQALLRQLLFPLGAFTKDQVRRLAADYGLPVLTRPESQDVCFLADHDYRRFLRERLPEALRPGPILDRAGRTLGEHQGLPYYTVGQREGLGIAAPTPLYVIALDSARNALIVGPARALGRREFEARELRYIAGAAPAPGAYVEAKIRYRARRVPATFWPLPTGAARLRAAWPIRDVAPGQAVVFYRGEEVVGGGIIQ